MLALLVGLVMGTASGAAFRLSFLDQSRCSRTLANY